MAFGCLFKHRPEDAGRRRSGQADAVAVMIQAMSAQAEFTTALGDALRGLGLALGTDALRKMFSHYELVVEANREFNLTRITSPADAAVKHYADSLSVLKLPGLGPARPGSDVPQSPPANVGSCGERPSEGRDGGLRVLDVGTGAGFPAVPLAIACQGWQVLAIDGTGKKARFVADSASLLGLPNLSARHTRAVELGQEAAATFDLVLLRAVSKLADGLKEVYSLVAPHGRVVFYKTPRIEPAELAEGSRTAKRLDLAELPRLDFALQAVEGAPLARSLVVYERQC